MPVEAGFAQKVMATAGVQAVLGNPARFYPVVEPEDAMYPCAIYRVISDPRAVTLPAKVAHATMRIQVDAKSGGASNASYAAAKSAQLAIRTALELFAGLFPDGSKITGVLVAN